MVPRALVVASFTASLFLTPGCTSGKNGVVHRDGRPDVLLVDSSDVGMLAAIDSARLSAGELVRRIRNPPVSQTDLAVKVRVVEGEIVEHLWITDVAYDGTTLRGRVNNDPIHLVRVKLGDSLAVRPSELSDWMAIDGGRLMGGYSIRLLRARMNAAERARLDSSVDFTFDP